MDYPASRVAGIGAAVVAGGILTAAMATIGWRWFRSERTDTSKAALLAFVGFVFAGAALAAAGRGMYGFDYAVQERYAVGPLLAWQALAVFVFSRLDRERALRVLTVLVVAIPIALLPDQLKAVLKPDVQDQMAREVSLKALQTGQSDDPEVDQDVKRLKQKGIVLGQ